MKYSLKKKMSTNVNVNQFPKCQSAPKGALVNDNCIEYVMHLWCVCMCVFLMIFRFVWNLQF